MKASEGVSLGKALLLWENQRSGKDIMLLKDVAMKEKGSKETRNEY